MTEQEFQTIDVESSAVQVQSAVQDAVQPVQSCTDESAILEVCSPSITLSPLELAEKIGASLRSVYGYANKLLEIWSWVPESTFRVDGRYTPKALEEMKKLKDAKNASEYAATVTKQTGNYTQKGGTLARVEVNETVNTLAAKPLPELPVFNIPRSNTLAIRQRTQQIGNINQQLTETMKQLIAVKVANKAEELEAKIDEVFAEAENFAVTQANQALYNSVINKGQQND